MNEVYCAKCGLKISVHKKAMPNFGRIINLIEPHECGEVIEPDLSEPADLSPLTPLSEKENKFVQLLNNLEPPSGDRRPKENLRQEIVTSTAPQSLLNALKKSPELIPRKDSAETVSKDKVLLDEYDIDYNLGEKDGDGDEEAP